MARQSIAAAALARGAAVALILAQLPAQAAESAMRFDVNVVLSVGRSEIGACTANEASHPLGVTATVTCAPFPAPKPVVGNTVVSSLLFHISRAGEWLGTVDESMGAGTVTSWRVIRIADRDYLEMMVGW